jgi:hypothetical protein
MSPEVLEFFMKLAEIRRRMLSQRRKLRIAR